MPKSLQATAASQTSGASALPFREIWCCDLEFYGGVGALPTPVCMVAVEALTGKTVRLWQDELKALRAAPFDTGDNSLFAAYYASAEIGCFLALGWDPPERILDLYTEFRAETNGLPLPHGTGLLGALTYFGLPAIGAEEKSAMRELVLTGGPWSTGEHLAILDYCEGDVKALERLLDALSQRLLGNVTSVRLGHALLRGRYMAAIAHMERNGVPIDTVTLERVRTNWSQIKKYLIASVDADYGVYEGSTFKTSRFEAWLASKKVPWPRLPSGRLALDDETFRSMALLHPAVAPLRELRQTLVQLKLSKLQVGPDGRNRCMLSAFRSKTGRNQPSNAKFIFGPSRWLRGLIKPPPGYGLAYLDFSSQELAVAAALFGDRSLSQAYVSGDPYMQFAIQAGLAPKGADKHSHKQVRDWCKQIVLGVGYGMGPETLAQRAGISECEARELLRRHHETYRVFWQWADTRANAALAGGTLCTVFGWPLHFDTRGRLNPRSLLNFPMQANGAEMLRLAACEATERGLRICAPIHDALLLEAPLEGLDDQVATLREIMMEASSIVMDGLRCRVDVEIIRYPDRYRDERGGAMWDQIMQLLPGGACGQSVALE